MSQPQHILLVDDSTEDVAMVLRALRKQDLPATVTVACDGADALDYLLRQGEYHGRASGHPHAVFLDLKMPRVDGTQVLRRMKADGELKLIPVIMFTSSREACDVLRCYELGVNAYVVKPMNPPDFTQVVQAISRFWTSTNEPPPQNGPADPGRRPTAPAA